MRSLPDLKCTLKELISRKCYKLMRDVYVMNETSPDLSNLPEIYVPEFNLQGEKFPFFILWKKKLKRILLSYSKGLVPSSLNNVSPSNISLGNNTIKITKTDVEGYLSGLFECPFDQNFAEKYEKIHFKIELEDNIFDITKEIQLFRPDVKIDKENIPTKISLILNKDSRNRIESITPTKKISLVNQGAGTAILLLDLDESSGLEIVLTPAWEQFVRDFYKDLETALKRVSDEYPKFEELRDDYVNILKVPFPTKKSMEPYKDTMNKLEVLMNDNEKFSQELVGSIVGVITRNLSLTRQLQEFVNYLLSIRPYKIFLVNPFSEVKIPKGKNTIGLRVYVTDLSWNDYSTLETGKFDISSEEEVTIPLVSLLSFTKREKNDSQY
jgi:hypothetical protein